MELRQLEYFVAVAAEMSFSRAATRAHVVQSALSASVAKLERELDVQLFDRSRQQISLTAAGERFRSHALEVLNTARSAAESIQEFHGTLSGIVEFGSLIAFGPLDVAAALGQFHRDHPHVRLRLHLSQSGASAYLTALTEGSLDLALVSVPERFPPNLDMRLLFEEPMVYVCRDEDVRAADGPIALADLADAELVGFPPSFGLRRLMDDAFHAVGVQSRTPYEVPAGFAAIAELVRNGLGTAFMPSSEADRFGDLRTHPLAQQVIWQVYLASPPAARMTPAVTRLADTLMAAAAAIPAPPQVPRRKH
jgi:DNA-binding transcriptional LysR family regulator